MKTDMIVKTGVFVALTVLLSYIFAIHTTFSGRTGSKQQIQEREVTRV